MADVFISYAEEDREAARDLARLVEAQGYSVWWDRKLAPGAAYANVIEQVLDEAKAVIVLWSEASRKSHWVCDEAAVGRDRNRLVPIALDATQPPLGFRQLHTVTFATLNTEDARQPLWSSLAGLCGRASQVAAPAQAPRPAAPSQKPLKVILNEEKRQRSFLRTFWITSFMLSGLIGLAFAFLQFFYLGRFYFEGDLWLTIQEHLNSQWLENSLLMFAYVGASLVIGRFFIVIGRRLSKRKSTRYFDGPTLIVLVCAAAFTIVMTAVSMAERLDTRIDVILFLVNLGFMIFGALSIPIGFARGLKRTTFEEGR